MITEKDIADIYTYICEYARMIYDYESRRTDSIIRQATQMQTAFSFMTAALFMVAQLKIEESTPLSGWFLFAAYSSITVILLASLFAATMAQNRKRGFGFEDAKTFRDKIVNEYKNFITEEQRQKYLAEYYEKIQADLSERNNEAVEWIQLSMKLFYCALAFISIFFFLALFLIGIKYS